MSSSDADERLWRIARDLTESQHESAGDPQSFPRIPRYDVQDLLGEGATAIVYRARDRELNLPVALKVLREATSWSEITRQRFRREAQTAAGLNDPHLVRVFDVGETSSCLYLVMELIEGRPLTDLLKEKQPDDQALVRVMAKVARGIAAAHAKGIVHRDLKPANILIGRDGEPKVADFGLAHVAESETALTKSGTVLGTPLYMAPEQVLGHVAEICPRTDVYGLGAILYEALTGRPPHHAETVAELYPKIVHEETVPPRRLRASVPRDLETLCMKALDRDKARRYPSAAEFADDLDRFLAGEPILAKRASPFYRAGKKLMRHRSGIALAIVLLAVGAALFLRQAPSQEYETAYRLGVESWREREADAAIEGFRKAAEAAPGKPDPWVMLGRVELSLGRDDRASEAWSEALRRDSKFPAARFERGKETLCRLATRWISPSVDPATNWLPVRLARGNGDAEELRKAQADLQAGAVAELDARRFVEGAQALVEGRYGEAVPLLQSYAEMNSWDGASLALLGIACHYAGDPGSAEQWLSSALTLRAEKPWRKLRGDARYLQGNDAGARSDYVEAAPDWDPEPLFSRRIPTRNLVLWLRADAGVETVKEGEVKRWADQSGHGRHAVQRGKRGPIATAGGVRFSSADDELKLPDGFEDFSEGLSIFVVGERTEHVTNWTFVEFGTATVGIDIVLGRSFGEAVKFTVFDRGTGPKEISAGGALPYKSLESISVIGTPSGAGRLYRRGALVAMSPMMNPRPVLRNSNTIGRFLKGQIAELLVFNRSLTDLERIGVEVYLKGRHFSPPPLEKR